MTARVVVIALCAAFIGGGILALALSEPPWVARDACRAGGGVVDHHTRRQQTGRQQTSIKVYRCDYRWFRAIPELP